MGTNTENSSQQKGDFMQLHNRVILSMALVASCFAPECGSDGKICVHLADPAWKEDAVFFASYCQSGASNCYLGKPDRSVQAINQTNGILTQSLFSNNYQVTGLKYYTGALGASTTGRAEFSVLVNPQDGIDSPAALLISNVHDSKEKISTGLYAGNYGAGRHVWCGTRYNGSGDAARSNDGIWEWNQWYLLRVVYFRGSVECQLYSSNESGLVGSYPLWAASTSVTSSFEPEYVGIAQLVGTPGAGTWKTKAVFSDICLK